MKNIVLSSLAFIAMSTVVFAGKGVAIASDIPVIEEELEMTKVFKSHFYIGGGYSLLNFDIQENAVWTKENYNTITALMGYKLSPYLATELRYTKTVSEDDTLSNTSLYLKPQYPMSQTVDIYALLGYAELSARDSSGTGFQYGVGMEYKMDSGLGLFADYTVLYDDKLEDVAKVVGNDLESTASSITVGLNYHF
jgi:opacity protein-like surface antigen